MPFSSKIPLPTKLLLISALLYSATQTFVAVQANNGNQMVEASVLFVAAGGNCGIEVPCFTNIQDAIDSASVGDTIKVAQGIYTANNDAILEVVYISKPITIQGGFTITDWVNPLPEINITQIDAQHNRRGIYINSIDQGLINIDGIQVINGGDVNSGAGIYLNQGNVSIVNSIISNNNLDYGGGAGVFVDNLGVLTLENSIIDNNSIFDVDYAQGGGLAALGGKVTLRNNVFQNNLIGGGIYAVGAGVWSQDTELIVENNRFENNQILLASTSIGGAIMYSTRYQCCHIVLSKNHFINNTKGVWIKADPAYLVGASLEGNFFIGDPLYVNKGVVTAQNDIISDNIGDGVILGNETLVTAKHWTIANNTGNGITGSGMNLSNSIIAYNDSYGITGENTSAHDVLFYNNGSNCGGGAICTNTYIGNPEFADLSNRDYHILPGSSAQDRGSDVGTSVDIDSETRPIGEGYDLGADEISLPPTASFTSSSPDWIDFPTIFTDTSQVTGVTSYLWSFGDGNFSEEFSPQHQYLYPEIYTVTLTVNNYGGSDSIEQEVKVYGAVFNASNPVWLGQEVIFSNVSIVDDLTTFEWNFGDGETSTEIDPRHSYSAPGIYSVTLHVYGIEGSSSTSKDIVVYSEPTANFSSDITTGFAPLSVNFFSTSFTTPLYDPSLIFLWDFGDGDTSSQENPNHTYQSVGNYSVSLTVSNAAGSNMKVLEGLITVEKLWNVFLPISVNSQ